jgi:hypothetical protein
VPHPCNNHIYIANPVLLTFIFNIYYWNLVILITGLQLGISNYFSFVSNLSVLLLVMHLQFSVTSSCIFFNYIYLNQ